MSGEVLLYWDPEIDGAFRRRFERALGELQVDFADASAVDPDPDAPRPVRVAVVSPRGQTPPHEADLVVTGGPSEIHVRSNLRLESSDIEQRSRRWIAFLEKLGAKLHREGLSHFGASLAVKDMAVAALAFPADPLARDASVSLRPEVLHEQLAVMTARAEEAERAVATASLKESDALRAQKMSEAQAAAARARMANLEHEIARLEALTESTAYALANVPEAKRATVTIARDHAWRARLALAQAHEAATTQGEALTWKSGASYAGETANRLANGYGVILFRRAGAEIARYAGSFENGRRHGHGVGVSEDGHTWTGQWREDEPVGFGLFEKKDGTRFEGEIAPDREGIPRANRQTGHTWPAAAGRPTHHMVVKSLPSPLAAE